MIVRDLLFTNRATFSQLLNSPEKIATNTLSNRLAKLVDEGIVEQTAHDLRYKLTDKGFDLAPVLLELSAWVEKYNDSVVSTAKSFQEYQKNPQAFMSKLKTSRE